MRFGGKVTTTRIILCDGGLIKPPDFLARCWDVGWSVMVCRPSFPLQNKATKWVHCGHDDDYAQIVNVSVTLSPANGLFLPHLFI